MTRYQERPVVFTLHARQRMPDRGASVEDEMHAIRSGEREPARQGLFLSRLNREFQRDWNGNEYAVQQLAVVVAEEPDKQVLVTVYTFSF